MGMAVGGPQKGPRSEINITPMVDVTLVLLIIFMVVTPLLQKNKDVILPRADHIDTSRNKEEDPLTFSITSDEHIWLGNGELAIGEIQRVVKQSMAENPAKMVLIKGDQRLKMKQVRLVMKEVQDAGAKFVGLGVDKPEEEK